MGMGVWGCVVGGRFWIWVRWTQWVSFSSFLVPHFLVYGIGNSHDFFWGGEGGETTRLGNRFPVSAGWGY